MNKRNLFYFGLEPIKSRYTAQLSKEWMPDTFAEYSDKLNFIEIEGEFDPDQQIKVGAVLDAVGRGKYSLSQCDKFLELINNGTVKNNDIIFLQDYWTPGLDAIWYALDLYGINVKVYAMLHAQSVDEYDFTYPMRHWMRNYELGLDRRMTGIFVGSTIHKEQLRAAGFEAPIHVVSLPMHKERLYEKLPAWQEMDKKDVIVYSSRLDKEKNPYFMLEVAKQFLRLNPTWEWHVTTSGKEFRSMLPGVVDALYDYAKEEPRFKMLNNLTKEEYYTELATCSIQFNSSLQDYVSWTIIESTAFGAIPIFPDFRSFPEILDSDYLYKPFDVDSAVNTLNRTIFNLLQPTTRILDISDLGRQMEGYIVANDFDKEINIWHEAELCKQLLKEENE